MQRVTQENPSALYYLDLALNLGGHKEYCFLAMNELVRVLYTAGITEKANDRESMCHGRDLNITVSTAFSVEISKVLSQSDISSMITPFLINTSSFENRGSYGLYFFSLYNKEFCKAVNVYTCNNGIATMFRGTPIVKNGRTVDIGYKMCQKQVDGKPTSMKHGGAIEKDRNYTIIQIEITEKAFSSDAELFVTDFLGFDRSINITLNGKLVTKSTDTVYVDSNLEICVKRETGDFSSIVLNNGVPVDFLRELDDQLSLNLPRYSESGISVNLYAGLISTSNKASFTLNEDTKASLRNGLFLAECYMFLNHSWTAPQMNEWLPNTTAEVPYETLISTYHHKLTNDEELVTNLDGLKDLLSFVIHKLSSQAEPTSKKEMMLKVQDLVSKQSPLVQDVATLWFSTKTWRKSESFGAEQRGIYLNPLLNAFVETYWKCLEEAHLRRLIADRSNDIGGNGYGVVPGAQSTCDSTLNKIRSISYATPQLMTKRGLSAITVYDPDKKITYLQD